MTIERYSWVDKAKFRQAIAGYNAEFHKGLIIPELVNPGLIFTNPGSCMMVSKDDGVTDGILCYNLVMVYEPFDLTSFLGELYGERLRDNKDNKGYEIDLENSIEFDGLLNGSWVAHVNAVEAFKNGAGRKLMRELKKEAKIEGICLRPLTERLIKYYRRIGFSESGLHVILKDAKSPIMLCKK